MIEQGSPEWFAARCGKATASKISDIIAKTKSGPSASRRNYEAQLVAERLTGAVAESFTSGAMQWGTDTEPQARSAYGFQYGVEVDQIAFVDHPKIAMSGASPDGLVGDEGLLEIKCPQTATHIDMLLTGKIDGKYITQMQWQMACTGRKWCDFVSFDPRLPVDLQLFCKRVERDQATIIHLETEVSAFLREVSDKVSALQALMIGEAA